MYIHIHHIFKFIPKANKNKNLFNLSLNTMFQHSFTVTYVCMYICACKLN